MVLTPGIEPVGGKEHREEQDDHRITPKRVPKAPELCLPRRVAESGDFGTIYTDHPVGVRHGHREHDPSYG